MTFEARDSAAKVVPARFKANLNSSIRDRESTMPSHSSSKCLQRLESKRTASSQTGGSSGVYKLDSCKTESEWSPKCEPTGRNALTAAFAQVWVHAVVMFVRPSFYLVSCLSFHLVTLYTTPLCMFIFPHSYSFIRFLHSSAYMCSIRVVFQW